MDQLLSKVFGILIPLAAVFLGVAILGVIVAVIAKRQNWSRNARRVANLGLLIVLAVAGLGVLRFTTLS